MYICHHSIESPLSLQQLSRVNLRRALGPSGISQLPNLGLNPEFVTYVQSILDICDGKEIKRASIEANVAEQIFSVEKYDCKTSGV